MMRFRKLIAGAAALTIAAASLATAAGAELIEIDDVKGANGLNIFDST